MYLPRLARSIVFEAPLVLFGSNFGLSVPGCLLLILLLLGPFLLLGIAARSLLSPEPLRGWAIAVMLLGTGGLAFLLILMGAEGFHRVPGYWVMWLVATIGALGTLPLVLLYEAHKRGWQFLERRSRRPRRR